MIIPVEKIKEAVIKVASENGATFALLFGSYARGTASERSDVDLIFIEQTNLRFLDRLTRYHDSLVDRLSTNVDTLVYTPEEFEQMKKDSFVARAVKEGIVLYEC